MTIDEAAERRIREITEFIHAAYKNPVTALDGVTIENAIRVLWIEATEAAAKKCDAFAEPRLNQAKWAAERCAELIRGKGG